VRAVPRLLLPCAALAWCALAHSQAKAPPQPQGPAQATDIYSVSNSVRSRVCAGGKTLPPLSVEPRLEAAAAAMARGAEAAQAMKSSGYRATRYSYISISGAAGDRDLVYQLGRNYCVQLTDRDIADMGLHRAGDRAYLVLAAPFAPRVQDSQEIAGRKVLELVNEARRRARTCGRAEFPAAAPVRWNELLALASQRHAQDMARNSYLSHDARDGSTPPQRVESAGYRYRATGENIAGGPTKAEEAVAGWLKSPPHCANVMNPTFTEMGVAYATDARSELGVYWAQVFGTPR
jgi:uncharacterized protein YkwD